jgi:hypothetical protein
MRVRISYSLEMDDIPAEVSTLIQKKTGELHEVIDLVEDACERLQEKSANVEMITDAIDRARQRLAEFDLVLADSHGILAGWIEAKDQIKNPPPPTPETTGPAEMSTDWPPEDLDV